MLANAQTGLTLTAGEWHDAFKRVQHAVSQEETRFYLRGVFVHCDGGKVKFVATDGHRLALVEKDIGSSPAITPAILPEPFVADIVKATRLSKEAHKPATLQVAGASAVFTVTGGTVLTAAPIEGTFPDYVRIMPRGDMKHGKVTFQREDLLRAVSALHGFGGGVSHDNWGVKVRLSFGEKTVRLSHARAEYVDLNGEAWCELAATFEGGQEQRPDVGFNSGYLVDTVKSFQGNRVTFHYYDCGSPNLWTGSLERNRLGWDPGHTVVLMPIRVDSGRFKE